jgi:hypothetical protein
MVAIVAAVPEVEARTRRSVIVVGGLAVMCRLGSSYRVTTDLDTVNRRRTGEPAMLEVLVSSPGTQASGPSGALVPTSAGMVQVDVLEVSDADLEDLPADPSDRLHVLSHEWAARSATPMNISAEGKSSRGSPSTALPAPGSVHSWAQHPRSLRRRS